MSCATTQLPALSFFCPHAKPHGVRRLSKHYHLRLDPKLCHGKCEIQQIPFARIAYTTMLYKPWSYNVDPNKHSHYQPIDDCTYRPVLGSFNNCNIIQSTNKTTSTEDFDAVYKVVRDVIIETMAFLVQLGKYGATNSAYPTKMVYYVIKYLSEPYTLQEHQTTYRKVIKSGELVVKPEYLSIFKEKLIGIGNSK